MKALEVKPCEAVTDTFGADPVIMMGHFPDDVATTADNLEASHARSASELYTGAAASSTIRHLGCTSCELAGCGVYDTLQAKVDGGELHSQMRALSIAPAWLTAARIGESGKSFEEFLALSEDTSATRQAITTGEINPTKLLAGVQNEPAGLLPVTALPELASLKNFRLDTPLEAHNITTDHGNKLLVIDASSGLSFKGERPSMEDYTILCAKLLNRMKELDSKGRPQILNADQKMQKQIKKVGDSWMFELRMNGKNRIYILANQNTEDKRSRITILGAHGGDAQTQRDFIDVAAATV